jgi:hypothetical protein
MTTKESIMEFLLIFEGPYIQADFAMDVDSKIAFFD